MVAETEVKLGIHHLADALLYVVARYVPPGHRGLGGSDNVGELLVLVAERLGDHEGYIHVAALPHAAGQAVAGGTEAAEDVRWKFPPEH